MNCVHYDRGCDVKCSQCKFFFSCRLCHDLGVKAGEENEEHTHNTEEDEMDHVFKRKETQEIRCRTCRQTQSVSNKCVNEECGEVFGRYYCEHCRLWENDPKKSIFHCDGCGICRMGKGLGQDFFHCDTCGCCLAIRLQGSHICRERTLDQNCPVCLEFLHSSTRQAFLGPLCGHAIHHDCYVEMLKNGRYLCPLCQLPLVDLKISWYGYVWLLCRHGLSALWNCLTAQPTIIIVVLLFASLLQRTYQLDFSSILMDAG